MSTKGKPGFDARGRFAKGHVRSPNAGIKKGQKTSTTLLRQSFRDALIGAFHDMGGQEAMVAWGRKNKTQFYKIAAKLVPLDITGLQNLGLAPPGIVVLAAGLPVPQEIQALVAPEPEALPIEIVSTKKEAEGSQTKVLHPAKVIQRRLKRSKAYARRRA
jgi:hypothetical protein